ncbi:MAG: hypothetical protein WCR06_03290 [bacterium]
MTKAGSGGWGRTRGRAVARRPESAGTRLMRRPVVVAARGLKGPDARKHEGIPECSAQPDTKVPRRYLKR